MSSYLLQYNQYTLCNALLWGNCCYHFNNVCKDGGKCWNSVFHFTVAMIECIPLIGQIVSLAEFFIGILYYHYFQDLASKPNLLPTTSLSWPPPDPYQNDLARYAPNHPSQFLFEGRPLHSLIQPSNLCPGSQLNERGFFYSNLSGRAEGGLGPLANVLWISASAFLNRTDLAQMRNVSNSLNSLIVRTPAVAERLPLSPGKLFDIITPKLFYQYFHQIKGNPQELQRRIIWIQRVFNEIDDHWFKVTSDTLSMVQTECSADNRAATVILVHPDRSCTYSLAICPGSTHESLFMQFLFRYAFCNFGIPLSVDSIFYTPGRAQGHWREVFAEVSRLGPRF